MISQNSLPSSLSLFLPLSLSLSQDVSPPIDNLMEDIPSQSREVQLEGREEEVEGDQETEEGDDGSDSDDDVKITIGSTGYRSGYGRLPSINAGGGGGGGGGM